MSGCYSPRSRPWLLFALKMIRLWICNRLWVILSASYSPLAFLKEFCVSTCCNVYPWASLVLTELCDLSAKLSNGKDQTLLFLERRNGLWIQNRCKTMDLIFCNECQHAPPFCCVFIYLTLMWVLFVFFFTWSQLLSSTKYLRHYSTT